jgi:hypothetical protein
MSNHNDLADLVLAHRRAADRVFESEVLKLRTVYGDRAVAQALAIAEAAERRDQVSISAERERRGREIRTQRRVQLLRQRRPHDERPGPVLPPGWR